VALAAWVGVLLLPWQPCRTRERLEADSVTAPPQDLGDVTVLIPARDESRVIAATLTALARQGQNLRIVVVDDESQDGTAQICERFDVDVVHGRPLPPGWGGKLWALEQGYERIATRYTLLLDADIELAPALVPALLRKAHEVDAQLVSVMARLSTQSFWEKLLVPPFVFFFKLLYPFARVNTRAARTAAAAGGCMLVETRVLREIGAFAAIRGALIDDCSLAARAKAQGFGIWLGLSNAVISRREYQHLGEFWQMVSRTAFTQLNYSVALLLVVALAMLTIFLGPLVAPILEPRLGVLAASALAIAAMAAAYLPTVRFYDLPWGWSLTLPVAGVLFLAMTLSSALNYWRGVRARWKSRAYAVSGE
jgi:hopene-associated glycosyltransferase HpnB